MLYDVWRFRFHSELLGPRDYFARCPSCSELVGPVTWSSGHDIGSTITVLQRLSNGGAVLEGRNFESVANHVHIFAGHKNDEEANDSENSFSGDLTTANIRNVISNEAVVKEGHSESRAGFGKILDAGNPFGNTAKDGECRPEFNQRLNHKDIGEEEHNHGDGEDREIGDDVSDPAAKGLGSGHDVLEEDDGGEDYLNNDRNISFKKFEN